MFKIFIKKNIHYLILSCLLIVFVFSYNSVSAQYGFYNPNQDPGVSGLLLSPGEDLVELNGYEITDSGQADFVINPNHTSTSIRIGGTSVAAEFDGDVNIVNGEIMINGAVIGTAQDLFPKFPDTPDEYYISTSENPSWEHTTTITIDSTKVAGSSNLPNFPVFFTGTYWFLRDWAHGGHVRSSTGDDIMFSMVESGSSELSYELEYYNPNTGEIAAWIEVPTLYTYSDTVIYMFYGNSSVSSPKEDPDRTWDNSYGLVQHMGNQYDSSGYNNTATFMGSLPDVTDGVANEAQSFNGSGDWMRIDDSSSISGQGDTGGWWGAGDVNSLSAWIKVDSWSNDPNDYSFIAGKGDWSSNEKEYRLYHRGDGNIYWELSQDGDTWNKTASIPDWKVSTGTWHHIAAVFNDSSCGWWGEDGYVRIYVDGVEQLDSKISSCNVDYIMNNSDRFGIGASGDNGASGGYDDDFNGLIDEVWFEHVERTSAWYTTVYNNQIDPDSFYDVVISDVGKVIRVNAAEDGLEFYHYIFPEYDGDFIKWQENGSDIYYNDGNVGINTGATSPSTLLHIKSNVSNNAEVSIQSGSNDNWVIYNDESSDDLRFWNVNQSDGIDNLYVKNDGKILIGTTTAPYSDDLTVDGSTVIEANSATAALSVYNSNASGSAIYSEASNYGFGGISQTTGGTGVIGEATSSAAYGVAGYGNWGIYGVFPLSPLGAGVEGKGGYYGGFFTTNDSNSSGLYGTANLSDDAIFGLNEDTTAGSGVRGDGLYGVYGKYSSSGGAGIKGISLALSSSTRAGLFAGDVVMARYDSKTPVYVDIYDSPSAPPPGECTVSYTPSQAIEVQRGIADIGRWGGTEVAPTDFTEFADMNSVFVLNGSNRYTNSGPPSSASNMEIDDMSGALALTGTDTISFYRDSGSYNADTRFHWESWEYKGPSGGPNEFIVRGRFNVSISAGNRTATDSVTSCSDRDKCIPFITGILNGDSSDDADNATAVAWMSADGTVTVERGGSTDTTSVYGVVVEFTGSNWSVAHGRTGNVTGDTGTIDLYEESVGTSGTTYNVANWSNAIIFHQFKADDNSSNQAIVDTSATYYPGGNSDEVDWYFDSGHDANDNQHMVHILENSDMNVTRFTNNGSSEGDNFTNISSAGLTDLSNAAIVGSANSSGTGTAYARGWKGIYLYNTSYASDWAHRSGNGLQTRLQVIEMPMDQIGSGDFFGRMMLETTNHNLYICTASGWQAKQLK